MLPLILSASLLISPAVAASRNGGLTIRGDGFIRSSVSAHAGVAPKLRHKRQDAVSVTNQKTGTSYTVDIEVGTPAQSITVILDTGSPDLWVNPVCQTSGQESYCAQFSQFDYTQSSTIQDTGYADVLSYGKGNVTIEYVTDMVTIGSAKIKDQIFGIGLDSYDIPMGILGLSPPVNPANAYPYVLDTMATQGLIKSRAFSLDLRSVDDPNGSIVFGGVDTGKYIGALEKMPMLDPAQTPSGADRYWITMTGIGITLPDGTSQTSDPIEVPVFLDSGGTLSRLPTAIFQAIGGAFPGAQYDPSSGFFVADCSVANETGSVDFIFNSKVISVPYGDFIWETSGGCVVGVLPDDTEPVLGDSFLRAAYVVYDQDNRNLHLAQAANCGTNLVAIGSGVNAVPSSTGACTGSSPSVTAGGGGGLDATATRAPTNVITGSSPGITSVGFGPGPVASRVSVSAGGLTSRPTGTGSSAEPSATKKSAAASSVTIGYGALVALCVVNLAAWAL
ncbi:aspartic peptidase domain-containing protein [Diplogelasinospora grovesii]|uniref:Aspartic peptidase domain-containing protein n=1 Tax=Diplogelasinospora grovesii TaxID=303347 RepID=A0AAN6N785_9PEZI|nr:aspartic peptidase domain-containing protein [Diplogelasinospora grovesii]